MPAQYDHVRPAAGADPDVPPGVYRVVGSDAERVTLLRVGEPDGARAVTGDVVRVPRERYGSAFVPAENPDDGLSPLRSARSALEGWYCLVGNVLRRRGR